MVLFKYYDMVPFDFLSDDSTPPFVFLFDESTPHGALNARFILRIPEMVKFKAVFEGKFKILQNVEKLFSISNMTQV